MCEGFCGFGAFCIGGRTIWLVARFIEALYNQEKGRQGFIGFLWVVIKMAVVWKIMLSVSSTPTYRVP